VIAQETAFKVLDGFRDLCWGDLLKKRVGSGDRDLPKTCVVEFVAGNLNLVPQLAAQVQHVNFNQVLNIYIIQGLAPCFMILQTYKTD